ncbi:hypothetical protein chiPu_0015834 [Chiloscyllium punctatum]|uniref:Uncharacterized protein n=1 Tax=Chiloscyllium punctatum TaxID=137246 RepID=A0A401T3Z2_CHIPU|nr:hypothetical protein [Chiloscyllium punctatum]
MRGHCLGARIQNMIHVFPEHTGGHQEQPIDTWKLKSRVTPKSDRVTQFIRIQTSSFKIWKTSIRIFCGQRLQLRIQFHRAFGREDLQSGEPAPDLPPGSDRVAQLVTTRTPEFTRNDLQTGNSNQVSHRDLESLDRSEPK